MFHPDLPQTHETNDEQNKSVEEVLKGRVGRPVNITKKDNRDIKLRGILETLPVNDSGYIPTEEYRVNVGTEEKQEYIEFTPKDVENLSWPDPNRPKGGKGGVPRPTFDLK